MSNIPIVHLEVQLESMRMLINHALVTHSEEINAEIDRQIEYAIKNFDFSEVIAIGVNEALRAAIKNIFRYSSPITKTINEAVTTAVEEIFNNREVSDENITTD